jgi:hypothetical protein
MDYRMDRPEVVSRVAEVPGCASGTIDQMGEPIGSSELARGAVRWRTSVRSARGLRGQARLPPGQLPWMLRPDRSRATFEARI